MKLSILFWKLIKMPKSKLSRFKCDSSKKAQVTISKFFSPSKKSTKDFEEEESDPDETNSPKKRKSSVEVLSPFSKKSKICPDTASGQDGTHDVQLSKSTKKKLHAFSLKSSRKDKGVDNSKHLAQAKRRKVASKVDYTAVKSKQQETPSTKDAASANNQIQKRSKQGGSNSKYTPLEQQFVELKKEHPGVLLLVECGYKYKFFGEDAEIAGKELNIFCHLDHNFMVASIPVHRLFVHARRLVAKGYKIGVVKQTETAALKAAGDNRNAPFARKLSALYTKSTLVGEDLEPVSGTEESAAPPSTFLMCIYEKQQSKKRITKPTDKQWLGFVAVQPSTGEIIYDCFRDSSTRTDLDMRLQHIQPVELLLPIKMSDDTEKQLDNIVLSSTKGDDRIRVERIASEKYLYANALKEVTEFYQKLDDKRSQTDVKASTLQEVLKLPSLVISCLAVVLAYLKEFKLDRVLQLTRHMTRFTCSLDHMKLNACTLRNLEIFQNQSNGCRRGSLVWVLDHTKTRFGARQLKKWISNPLMNIQSIKERQDSITELLDISTPITTTLMGILSKGPDLEKGLCSIYHKKCSTFEFYSIVEALSIIGHSVRLLTEANEKDSFIQSGLLKNIVADVPALLENVDKFMSALSEKAAKDGNKTELFVDTSQFPEIKDTEEEIDLVYAKLKKHKREIRNELETPSFDYITVSGNEFLIEIRNNKLMHVPRDWVKISSTKTVSRFRTPYVVEQYKLLCQLRETLVAECHLAWLEFLDEFGESYFSYQKAVKHIATVDCLLSLAEIARDDKYCKPEIVDGSAFVDIKGGCHPVVSALLDQDEQYVPNDTCMQADAQRCLLITGPNMGGKSSYIRQVALIAIMAQVGSYVPAEFVRMSAIDAIHTRMGASDSICDRQSTFMVELQEASDILQHATPRSLVIMDELGRGTSTHDGVAIAYATAQHLITQVKCLTLFVTHYPSIAELEARHSGTVANYHMSFLISNNDQDAELPDVEIITFLYKHVKGSAGRSYGLNVARLADIPHDVLQMASIKSKEMERSLDKKSLLIDNFKTTWSKPARQASSSSK